MSPARSIAIFASLALSSHCSDLSTPADLDREQIIAIRATPKTLQPNAHIVLDTLLAGPDGPITASPSWSLPNPPSGVTLRVNSAGGVTITCDSTCVPESNIPLSVGFTLPDGQVLRAQKNIAITNEMANNPTISEILVDGVKAAPGDTLRIPEQSAPRDFTLSVTSNPSASTVAWYNTIGEIRYYRSPKTSLAMSDFDVRLGWVVAVVRDDSGGIAWQSFSIERDDQ